LAPPPAEKRLAHVFHHGCQRTCDDDQNPGGAVGEGAQTTSATANLGGTPTAVIFSITATVSGASQMTAEGGDAQIAQVGTLLPAPLSVRVADQFSNPVPDVTVSWAVISGGGSVAAPTSVTNASGIASIAWTLGPTTAAQVVRATAAGSGNFFATATPGQWCYSPP
jgi:hypothetical protein